MTTQSAVPTPPPPLPLSNEDDVLWSCCLCRRVFLDGDFHNARNTPKLPHGVAGIEVQERWCGSEPVCRGCGEARGIPADTEN